LPRIVARTHIGFNRFQELARPPPGGGRQPLIAGPMPNVIPPAGEARNPILDKNGLHVVPRVAVVKISADGQKPVVLYFFRPEKWRLIQFRRLLFAVWFRRLERRIKMPSLAFDSKWRLQFIAVPAFASSLSRPFQDHRADIRKAVQCAAAFF